MTQLPVRPTIVLGPPGTGKTTTLIRMVSDELAAGTPPDRIGYVTFTRRGAQEARDRMSAQHDLRGRSVLPWFSTLHSLSMRCLGLGTGAVMEGARLQEFADLIGERLTGRFSQDDGSYIGYDRGDRMLFMDNLARVRQILLRQQYDESHDDIDWVVVERFSRALAQFKRDRGLVDYTDLLHMFASRGESPGLDVLFVDEAQDLSRVQWDVVRVLCRGVRRVVVAGDDDQAIFRWAGADVDTLLDLEGDVRVLDQSYRVPRRVQSLAASVVARLSRRRDKRWMPRDAEGDVSWVPRIEDLDWSGSSVLVMARNQYLLDPLMREMRASGVLYTHHGHPSVRQSLLTAIVTWERLRQGQEQPADHVQRVLDLMTVGVGVDRGKKTKLAAEGDRLVGMAELRQQWGVRTDAIWHEALDRVPDFERSYMVRCRRQGEKFSAPPRVRIDTIHASKGAEADHVVLLTDMATRTHRESLGLPDDEARVWYVGVTRAKERLTIVMPRTRQAYPL